MSGHRSRRRPHMPRKPFYDIIYVVKNEGRIVHAHKDKDKAIHRAGVIFGKYNIHLVIVEETLRKSEGGQWIVIHKMVHEFSPYRVPLHSGLEPAIRPVPQTPDSAAYQIYVDSLT